VNWPKWFAEGLDKGQAQGKKEHGRKNEEAT